METNIEKNVATAPSGSKPYIFYAIIFLLVVLASGFIFSRSSKLALLAKPETVITQSILKEQYGLRVNLIAVTAAGGMLDLRLKMVDAEKAKLLLSDPNNFPALRVNNRTVLTASEDAKSQVIKFEDGGDLFLLYPNSGNAVKPGDAITILFGDLALEQIQVR